MEVCTPYYIPNKGIFELDRNFIDVGIKINYINKTNARNITSSIFTKCGFLPKCKAFNSLKGNFTGDFSNFNITALINFISYFDISEPINYLVNITFRARYFFNLIKFSISQFNLDLSGE